MNEDQRTRISKFLSLVLRHDPGKIGLTLHTAGWADVDDLLAKLHSRGRSLSRTDLEEVVTTNEKKRYAFSEDGHRIRASQGHSVDVERQQQPVALLLALEQLWGLVHKSIIVGPSGRKAFEYFVSF